MDFSIDTDLRSSALLMAWAFLDEDEAMRITRCPECHTVFYGQLGQVFCTRRCANNSAAKTYRQKHLEKRRGKARLAYEAKQKEKYGPHVKIGRRPKRPAGSLHRQAVRRNEK